MPIPIAQIDAFSDKPFAVNPAAVCILPAARDERWMQDVAREMNLSEAAYLVPRRDGFNLRWFTPTVEVELCGHATLASAHALCEQGHLKSDEPARFFTRSGLLTCERHGDWIQMNFPANPDEPVEPPLEMASARGGVVRLRVQGDRVILSGQAVTVRHGELL